VACEEANIGSRVAIERAQGQYENSCAGLRRYWIQTAAHKIAEAPSCEQEFPLQPPSSCSADSSPRSYKQAVETSCAYQA
jgi:hypothetical protein